MTRDTAHSTNTLPHAARVRIETLLGMLAREGGDTRVLALMRELAPRRAILGSVETASEAQRAFEILLENVRGVLEDACAGGSARKENAI